MIVAYILAKVEAGKDRKVLNEVEGISGVTQATLVYGVYDLHVEVSFAAIEELDEFVFNKMRRVPGIKETVTLVGKGK